MSLMVCPFFTMPASENVSSYFGNSSFGLQAKEEWFEVSDFNQNLKRCTVKKEYEEEFLDYTAQIREAQRNERTQIRKNLVDSLTNEQITYLSNKYDPRNMSHEEYRSFLEDLHEFGYFSEEDMACVSYDSMPVIQWWEPTFKATLVPVSCGLSDFYNNDFPENGNVLDWTRYLTYTETSYSKSGTLEKTEEAIVAERLQKVLAQLAPGSYSPERGTRFTPAAHMPGYTGSFPSDGNMLSWAKYWSAFGAYHAASGTFEKSQQALLDDLLENVLTEMK